MRTIICATGGAAAHLLVSSPAMAAPLIYQCSAPSGANGAVRQFLSGPTYQISGTIRPGTLEDTPDPSLPLRITVGNDIPSTSRSADVTLLSAEDEDRYVSLVVRPQYQANRSAQGRPDVYVIFRRQTEGETEERRLRTIVTRGYLWESLRFSIVAREDRVTVEAGGEQAEIPVALGAGVTVELNCEGGSFEFDRIVWSNRPTRLVSARR